MYQLIIFLNIKIKAILTIIIFALAIVSAANDNYRRFVICEDLSYHQYRKKLSKSEEFYTLREEGTKFADCLSRVQQAYTSMKKNNQREAHFYFKELKIPFELDLINTKNKR
jgi:IS4 transposase